MDPISKIFVVIDPTTDNQRALKRACHIAGYTGASIVAFLCVFSDAETQNKDALKRVELERHRRWLDPLIQEASDLNLKVDVRLRWDPNWRDALTGAANAANCDLIIKSTFRHGNTDRLLRTSDWNLLRTAHCPVLLIKRDVLSESGKVLVAVDLASTDPEHRRLNEEIITAANLILENRSDLQLHAINAYRSLEKFVDPLDLADRVGIERARVHIAKGAPEQVIPEFATKLDAELVIIGTTARRGVPGAVLGNTVERVLDHLVSDVLTVVVPA
jgi:universal stress protein E